MKKLFIIVVIAIISISASVVTTNVTYKPSQPKDVYIANMYGFYTTQDVIEAKYKQGYILKSLATSGNSCLIVMEKY